MQFFTIIEKFKLIKLTVQKLIIKLKIENVIKLKNKYYQNKVFINIIICYDFYFLTPFSLSNDPCLSDYASLIHLLSKNPVMLFYLLKGYSELFWQAIVCIEGIILNLLIFCNELAIGSEYVYTYFKFNFKIIYILNKI